MMTADTQFLYMMSACENECMISENEFIANIPHDELEFTGSGLLRKNIVAVYAVKNNTSGDDFIIVDDKISRSFSGCLMRCTHSGTIQLKGKRR